MSKTKYRRAPAFSFQLWGYAMSALLTRQQHYEEIRKLLLSLSTEEPLRLISEISFELHKKYQRSIPRRKLPPFKLIL